MTHAYVPSKDSALTVWCVPGLGTTTSSTPGSWQPASIRLLLGKPMEVASPCSRSQRTLHQGSTFFTGTGASSFPTHLSFLPAVHDPMLALQAQLRELPRRELSITPPRCIVHCVLALSCQSLASEPSFGPIPVLSCPPLPKAESAGCLQVNVVVSSKQVPLGTVRDRQTALVASLCPCIELTLNA